ncbi:MAG: hypothetical protein K2O67_01550, partial [Clostridia bacterium]|nr:hypothetical protein [Clostridia bacterium]
LPKDKFEKLKELADKTDGHTLLRTTEILTKTEGDLRYSADGRVTLESALIKAAMPSVDYDIEALLARVEKLERQVAEGVKVTVKAQQPAPEVPAQPTIQPAKPQTPERQKPELKAIEDDGFSPFGTQGGAGKEQATIFEQPQTAAPKQVGSLSDGDKASLFGRFIKLFRTTRRNAVLFTLCMDLESHFEGDTFVLSTPVEAVYKSLSRDDNKQFIAESLQTLGVFSFDIRLKAKGEDKYERAVGELRENFKGTDIQIK